MTDVPVTDPVAAYEVALNGAQAAETPQARQKFVDQMAILSHQLPAPGTAPAIDPTTTGQPPARSEDVAFPAPASASEYQFQAPPGVEVQNEVAAGALKAGLHEAGVPAPLVGEVFRQVAEMHANGAFADDRSYDAAVAQCRATLIGKHGEAAPALIREGVAYLNRLADRNPALEDAVAHALASPYAVAMAANLARYGTTRYR